MAAICTNQTVYVDESSSKIAHTFPLKCKLLETVTSLFLYYIFIINLSYLNFVQPDNYFWEIEIYHNFANRCHIMQMFSYYYWCYFCLKTKIWNLVDPFSICQNFNLSAALDSSTLVSIYFTWYTEFSFLLYFHSRISTIFPASKSKAPAPIFLCCNLCSTADFSCSPVL